MKGAKGGNRDRIISWLFSERTRKIREEELEAKKEEENLIAERLKERRKNKRHDDDIEVKEEIAPVVQAEDIVIESDLEIDNLQEQIQDKSETPEVKPNKQEEIIETKTMEVPENKPLATEEGDKNKDNAEILEIPEDNKQTLEIKEQEVEKDKEEIKPKDKIIEVSEKASEENIPQAPTLFIDEDVVEDLKEQSRQEEKERREVNQLFPSVHEVEISEESSIEKPELIQVSIIEEIDNLLRNDYYDLNDIKYKIEVLNNQEKDEVLLENIEKIQKELEDLIKKFNEIKKKYDYAYSNISIQDITLINNLDLGFSISDYIGNGKDGIDNSTTLNQIHEIEEFIGIINNIIEIEKQKDIVEESVESKLVDFSIRDDDFILLQDQYADVENINKMVDNYNLEMNSIIKELEEKIANNTEISKRMETTFEIVPDVNRMLQATFMLASAQAIPPTPAGSLFKATLYATAAHLMATAFTPREETREKIDVTVTDYSRDILSSKDTVKSILDNIEDAFSNITYMKDTFEKEFSQYKGQIPEYDELIKNIFSIEKELERQQYLAYDYSNKIDQALVVNNQKVKRLDYEND
ncbi:MAG: hypothetical protein IJN90_04040 [Bacilli bacterium]|nr:hypothetical protein [Bacilli bacterium]